MSDTLIVVGALSALVFVVSSGLLLFSDLKEAEPAKGILMALCLISACGASYYPMFTNSTGQTKIGSDVDHSTVVESERNEVTGFDVECSTASKTERYEVVGFDVEYSTIAETDVFGVDADSYTILPTGKKLPKKTLFVLLERQDTSEVWCNETSDPEVLELADKSGAGCKKMTLITKKVKRIKVGSVSARDSSQSAEDLHVECKYAIGDTVKVRGNRIVR